MENKTYQVVEIFDSIDGEGLRTGQTVSFVRLAGCNLRCTYCDTLYALFGEAEPCRYTVMTLEEILDRLNPSFRRVTLTGGEPLLSPGAAELVNAMTGAGYHVNIETNGAVDIAPFLEKLSRPEWMFFTMDYKLPSSGMEEKMIWKNFYSLRLQDVIKFVAGSEEDIDRMETVMEQLLTGKDFPPHEFAVALSMPHVFAGAVYGKLEPARLVEAILSRPALHQVQLQMQIHKIIWDPEKRGV